MVIAQSNAFYDMVYVDSLTGTAATVWPNGSIIQPTDTIAKGKTIADANRLRKLHCVGSLSLAAAMQRYSFFGDKNIRNDGTPYLLDLNAQDVDYSSFYDLLVTGEQGAGSESVDQQAYFKECVLIEMSRINANIVGCMISNSIAPCIYNENLWSDCSFGDVGTAVDIPTLTVGEVTKLVILNARGSIIIAGMTAGALLISGMNGLNVTINNSCIGGTILFTGDCFITDNSAVGCTITDNTLTTTLANIQSDVTVIKADTTTIISDVAAVKADTVTLISDVAAVKADTVTLISDVAAVKADTVTIISDVAAVKVDTVNIYLDIALIIIALGNIQGDITGMTTLVNRTLGLVKENQYLDTFVHDEGHNLTSLRLRIYSDANSVGSSNNVIATYTITATYNQLRELNTYKVTKD